MTFVFLSFLLANIAFAADSEIIYEQCYLIRSKSMENGFVCITQRRNNTGIVTEKHVEQRFKRQDNNIEIINDQIFVEDEAGKPLSFFFESKNPGQEVEINGKFDWKYNELIINFEVNGIKDIQTVNIENGILFPYAIDKLYRETQTETVEYLTMEPGFSSQFLRIKAQEVKNEDSEELKKYKLSVNIFPNAEMYEWRNKNGRVVKETSSLMDIEQIAVDKKEITNVKNDFNVFPESLIRVEKTITAPEDVQEIIYKISVLDIPVENIFFTDETQSIIQIQGNTIFLRTKKDENSKFPYPFDNREYEEYLKTGPFIITTSPKIQAVAEDLKAGETDAVKLAKKAERWVYNNITNKNLAVDFANAVNVLETGSGDCTEHSILLASVLRTMGIPAKVVVGLVYSDSPENAFVYHMWVKAYAGRWINLDPSFPYKTFTPLHLAMAESPLNDISAKTELVLDIIDSFSKISIEILNAVKPVVKEVKGRPELKINLNSQDFLANNNLINVYIKNKSNSDNSIHKIEFSEGEAKRDYLKSAFYSFARGDTRIAYTDLQEFHKEIHSDDDYAKMKLALKLINMSYFNFASRVLNEIKDREIWGQMIDELYKLYFPKKFMPEELENVQVEVFYYLNYTKQPELVVELTEDYEEYDYICYLRAKAFKDLKEYEKSENEINTAIEINPENLTYRLELINILSVQNKLQPAQVALGNLQTHARSQNVKNQEFWKTFNSYDYWLKVKEFRENPILSRYYEAYYYAVKGELDIASDILNKLVYRNQEAYLSELLGEIYYELEQYESAKKSYEKALALNENSIKANIGLGNIYFISRNNELAEHYYQKAVEKSSRNIDALLALAKLNAYLGNTEKSYEYFKQILVLDKDNTDVLYNLGITLANMGKFNEAEKILKRVLSVDPMQSMIWLDLAKVEFAKQNYTASLKYLKSVNYINEDNPDYYYFMAMICDKNDQKAEAEKYFKKAVQLKPELVEELIKKK